MVESEAHKIWVRENTMIFSVRLQKNTDADIIAWLEKQESRQGYIKRLIREDIEREKSGK